MRCAGISSALWGTVLGAMTGQIYCERMGRQRTLLWIGVFYSISCIGAALAVGKYTFMIARFIGGLGVGVATVASPVYISEISPAYLRGRLTGLFQLNIVFCILVALSRTSSSRCSRRRRWRGDGCSA